MNPYQGREPIWKQSERQAPFCPTCGKELDYLDMINNSDYCDCGIWHESTNLSNPSNSGTFFRPYPPKRDRMIVNGVEANHE